MLIRFAAATCSQRRLLKDLLPRLICSGPCGHLWDA
jgi:hypothetical protein